jgi:hypothetical protein
MPCECVIYESRGQKSIPWSYITNNYQGEKDDVPTLDPNNFCTKIFKPKNVI